MLKHRAVGCAFVLLRFTRWLDEDGFFCRFDCPDSVLQEMKSSTLTCKKYITHAQFPRPHPVDPLTDPLACLLLASLSLRMVHVAAVGIGPDKKKQQCYVVVQTKEAPDEDVWAKNLVPDMAERLSKRDIDVAGLVVWNRPMPLDPRHNSKIVYKQLAVNMAGAVEAIQSYDYAGSGAAQAMEMGQHRAVLFDRLSTQRSVGEVETKASDVEPKVDTAPLL